VAGNPDYLYGVAMSSSPRLVRLFVYGSPCSLSAWLIIALRLDFLMAWLPPVRYEFALPRVCVPYAPGSDVVSGVPDLFSALTLGISCIVLAEVAKGIFCSGCTRKVLVQCSFVVYQACLLLDVMRRYAWDWYGYLLYFCRLIELSYERPRPEVLALPAPWLSFLSLLLCMGIAFTSLPRVAEGRTP